MKIPISNQLSSPRLLLLVHAVLSIFHLSASFAPINTHITSSIRIEHTQTQTQHSNALLVLSTTSKNDKNIRRDSVQLYLFNKLFRPQNDKDNEQKEEDDDGDENHTINESDEAASSSNTSEKGKESDTNNEISSPTANGEKKEKKREMFFASFISRNKQEPVESTTTTSTSTTTTTTESTSVTAATETKPKAVVLTPKQQAESLKGQAERVRLEAEKMDIILTLQKIEKLEKELEKKSVQDDAKRQEDVMTQMRALKKKLDIGSGDASASDDDKNKDGSSDKSLEVKKDTNTEGGNTSSKTTTKSFTTVVETIIQDTRKQRMEQALTSEEIEERVKNFDNAPLFMQQVVVKAAGMEMDNLNTTALIVKMDDDQKQYLLLNGDTMMIDGNGNGLNKENLPEFSQEQIDEVVESLRMVPQFLKNVYGDEVKMNDTAIALQMLEEEWRLGRFIPMPEVTQAMIDQKLEDVKWIPQFLRGDNDTEFAIELIKMDYKQNPQQLIEQNFDEKVSKDAAKEKKSDFIFSASTLFGGKDQEEKSEKNNMVEALFPQTTRREGEEPTDADIRVVMVDVLAKNDVWMTNGTPEKVSGGFILRGYTKYDTGKEFIEAMDKNLEKSNVKEKVSIFYVFDPTPVTQDQMEGVERPPVLFVTGPKVIRDSAPIQRSIVSSLAIGTVWYNSLLPYLMNEKYMKLADEQLALADASMTANLDFLNDLSFPVFASILGIQIAHEVAHAVAAKSNGLDISFPTLVPSLESGLTGAITSLQSVPKDKQTLFDFAIAGPLTGWVLSTALLFTGMIASSSMDAASYSNLPALPLDLLRQSSLAGGIIDYISPGLLTVPDAALGSQALSAINIQLHPLAVAGYFGLMINAINLLPVGRTDGGRIALTLFGRSGAQLVSLLTYIAMFIGGLMGSDLLLFFFSYVVFFQGELEIPQRNEVDDMDFSRVLLATATGVLVLLTLIPM